MQTPISTYYDWTYMDVSGAASMGPLSVEFEILEAIQQGRSIIADFPNDAYFQMSDDHPKNVMLVDNVWNGENIPVVSPALRDFLAREEIPHLELLQVSIADHRGRTVADDYSLVHPCRIVDCIDQEESVFKWNRLNPTKMSPVRKLVLDASKLGPDDSLIRPRYIEHRILVREDLAERMLAQEFRGLVVTQLNE